MRWFWIDRFTEFVQGRRARAVKAVTLAEEQVHDHFPGAAMMPATLINLLSFGTQTPQYRVNALSVSLRYRF